MDQGDNKFGKLLREARLKKDITMGQLARYIEKTVSYISDVERGARAPFKPVDIFRTCELLDEDVKQFLVAAAETRGAYMLDADGVSDKARQFGAELMRGWPLADDVIDEFMVFWEQKKRR